MEIQTQEYSKTDIENKRSSTVFSGKLPKGWRKAVCEKLSKQGIEIQPQTITDLRRGQIKNLQLLEKVIAVMQKISTEYEKQEAKRLTLISP